MKKEKKKAPAKRPTSTTRSVKRQSSYSPYIICIGASAGGLHAVIQLLSQIPASINAAVFVVLHLSKSAVGNILVERIKRDIKLPCKLAENKEGIKAGCIYVAPPDSHLLVKNDRIILGHGPAENRFRPSIDVLFRSAAVAYGELAIGVILTGLLNDGTTGMWAIQQSGGHCIVQDPNEAEFPDMILSVLDRMEVDHVANLNKIPDILVSVTQVARKQKNTAPAEVIAESNLSEKMATSLQEISQVGQQTVYSCPDCGGGLWKIKNDRAEHLRCHIGHTYSTDDLVIKQSETIEQTLWVAVRMMEERKLLLSRLANDNKSKGLEKIAADFSERSDQLEHHITNMKEFLFTISKD